MVLSTFVFGYVVGMLAVIIGQTLYMQTRGLECREISIENQLLESERELIKKSDTKQKNLTMDEIISRDSSTHKVVE